MKCIIGLGNIGKEYEYTRHNMGFVMLDKLAEKNKIKIDKKMKKYMYGEGNVNGEKICLVKPTTYMNLSGEAIVELMNWYKIDKENIIVIYDDIDIQFGDVRYRLNGSAGTHNGMRNIIAMIKTEDFARIRVGIENRNGVPIPLVDYVLQRMSKEEIKSIDDAIYNIVEENVNKFLTK